MDNFDSKAFGRMLKQLREQRGYSQEDLAKILGMKRENISHYERGIVLKIPLEVLNKLADTFEVSVDELVGRHTKSESFDPTIRTIQRKAQAMSPKQRERALKIWEAAFDDDGLWSDEK